MTETYYSIRCGDPRYHKPYLLTWFGGRTPKLYITRREANIELEWNPGPYRKVVRVRIKVS